MRKAAGVALGLWVAALPAVVAGKDEATAAAAPIQIHVRPEKIVNGGVFWVEITGPKVADGVKLRWANRDVPAVVEGETATALLGVNVAVKPGPYNLDVTAGDYATKHRILVSDADYPVEHLTLPKEKVSGFSKQTLARIGKEKKTLDAIWGTTTPERLWEGGWTWPVDGKITSSFGKRRVINGEPRSPHSGTDHRAPKGTEVHAVNNGRVAFVGDQFFAGNCVVIDHGQGVYSMYFHFSETRVKPGDLVKRGDVIGKSGATGRASGPHLHWGVRLLDARVDPERLLALMPVTEEKPAEAGPAPTPTVAHTD